MNRFQQSLVANMSSFDFNLPAETVSRLGEYYSLLTRWNDRLHLVAPCSPEEFAVRHILESLMLLKHLPTNARVADIGSGGGLPIIPCLIARPDLHATLVESSSKKSVFLHEATRGFQATIIAQPFEQVEPPSVQFVTCRIARDARTLRPAREKVNKLFILPEDAECDWLPPKGN